MPEFALMSYVALMSITPGPNNLMLTASGVNFGFRRTVPHLLGISLGSALQAFIIASLISWALSGLEAMRLTLAFAGCFYLLWLSWKTWRAGQPGEGRAERPLGFFGAALFQWLNPKVWVMVINASLLFMPHEDGERLAGAAVLALVFAVVNLPCISIWAWMGDRLRQWLQGDRARRVFNGVMAALMAATALWLLAGELHPNWNAPSTRETMSVFDSNSSVAGIK